MIVATQVSIISPVLRMDDYLDHFLGEFEHQTIFPITEMILDLNAPSAETLRIIKKYEIKYGGKLIVHAQKHVDPIGVSMNRAIAKCSGKYIAIWNADDLRTPDSLALQYDLIRGNAAYCAVGGPYRVVSTFGKTDGKLIVNKVLDPSELLKGMYLGPFMMFDREILNTIGLFDEQLKSGADFDLSVRLTRAGRIGFTDGLLGYYLDAGLGASTRPNSLQAIERSVIELRYGMFDKFDPEYLPDITTYDLTSLYFLGGRHSVGKLFKNYSEYCAEMKKVYLLASRKNLIQRLVHRLLSFKR